jgi:hypothetical protein
VMSLHLSILNSQQGGQQPPLLFPVLKFTGKVHLRNFPNAIFRPPSSRWAEVAPCC